MVVYAENYEAPKICCECKSTTNLVPIISSDESEDHICVSCLASSELYKICKHCGGSVSYTVNMMRENDECYYHAPDDFCQAEDSDGYAELDGLALHEPNPSYYPDGDSEIDEYAPDSYVPPDTPVDDDE